MPATRLIELLEDGAGLALHVGQGQDLFGLVGCGACAGGHLVGDFFGADFVDFVEGDEDGFGFFGEAEFLQ